MTKKKRENLGVALEVRGETGAAASRELLPAAGSESAGLLVGGGRGGRTWVWERDARVRDGPLGESKVASVLDFEPRGRERWEEKVRGLPEGKRLAGKGSPKEGAVRDLEALRGNV